jgi:hypothetical protein
MTRQHVTFQTINKKLFVRSWGSSVPEARGQGGPDAGPMAGSPRAFLRGERRRGGAVARGRLRSRSSSTSIDCQKQCITCREPRRDYTPLRRGVSARLRTNSTADDAQRHVGSWGLTWCPKALWSRTASPPCTPTCSTLLPGLGPWEMLPFATFSVESALAAKASEGNQRVFPGLRPRRGFQ